MGIWDKLQKTEQEIRKRVEHAFGQEKVQMPHEVRGEILGQVKSRTRIDNNEKAFPFDLLTVSLRPHTQNQHAAFDEAFLQNGSLKADIMRTLKEDGVRCPEDLDISVELLGGPYGEPKDDLENPLFKLNFLNTDSFRDREIPETTLVIVKGSAEQAAYRMKKERILIGCLPEVLDREGRMVRKNDVVFLDNGDDINSTVGGIHARIWFDFERREFRIMDEASRYGTRIVRAGRSFDVPGGSERGIRLHSGDEIYCGSACIRFERTSMPDARQQTTD